MEATMTGWMRFAVLVTTAIDGEHAMMTVVSGDLKILSVASQDNWHW